jgi:hypothetical protein
MPPQKAAGKPEFDMVFKSRPHLSKNHMESESAYRWLDATKSTPGLEVWLQTEGHIFQEETK